MSIAGQMVIDSMGNITKTNHMDPEFIEQPREIAILVTLQMDDFKVQHYDIRWCQLESLQVLFYEVKVPSSDEYSTI